MTMTETLVLPAGRQLRGTARRFQSRIAGVLRHDLAIVPVHAGRGAESLGRGLSILEAVAESPDPVPLFELVLSPAKPRVIHRFGGRNR